MTPKISVIIAVFNGSKTLKNAIDSVLVQAYKSLEIVVIDGNSTDGTLEVLKKYNASNLIWISESDDGIYDAMNKGIKIATGEWIYFLGADDTFYNNNILTEIFGNIKNYECDFLYGNVHSLALNRKYDGKFDKERILFQNISHQSIFYKKVIFNKIGLYNKNFKTFADWDFNIKCFYNFEIKIKYIDILIANFAVGGLGTSSPDLFFIRNCLFEKNLSVLNNDGHRKLYNIKFYDKWWRLIRSMKLNEKANLTDFAAKEQIPKAIERMYLLQKKIPYKLLSKGIFSKSFMFVSYWINMLTSKFK
jgi:glycosyltransferase involved in cell wall biosynthesis